MHRVQVSLVLLIVAAIASSTMPPPHGGEAPLDIINPWLSACDLVQPATAPDLQGTCSSASLMPVDWVDEGPGPPPPQCPPNQQPPPPPPPQQPPSAAKSFRNESTTSNQCLYYLQESHKQSLCGRGGSSGSERQLHQLQTLRLRHCREHQVHTALGPQLLDQVRAGGAACQRILTALLDTDALAARISCEFTEILIRYDCGQSYSIVYHCDDCKEAYRRWVCSSLVPHFEKTSGDLETSKKTSGTGTSAPKDVAPTTTITTKSPKSHTNENGSGARRRIKPCRSVCQTVEQRCPYMLPGDRAPAHPTQYAGEPTFLCLDPNIPETGEQAAKSSYGTADCCYSYCEQGICWKCEATPSSSGAGEHGGAAVVGRGNSVNDTAWRVRCNNPNNVVTTPASFGALDTAAEERASNCAAQKQQLQYPQQSHQRPSSTIVAQDDIASISSTTTSAAAAAAGTSALHSRHLQTVHISYYIFAVAWTAVWTIQQLKFLFLLQFLLLLTLTIITMKNNYVINGLLLIFVTSALYIVRQRLFQYRHQRHYHHHQQQQPTQQRNNINNYFYYYYYYYYYHNYWKVISDEWRMSRLCKWWWKKGVVTSDHMENLTKNDNSLSIKCSS